MTDVKNLLLVFYEWLLIAALIYVNTQVSSVALTALTILLIGTRVHALGILMHEASHFNLFQDKKLNDWAARLLVTDPLLLNFASYRDSHLLHHKYTLTENDPTFVRKIDNAIFQFPKKSHLQFASQILAIFCGYGLIMSLRDLKRNRAQKNRGFALLYVALYITLLASPYRVYFLLFWVLPILCVVPTLNYWRTIAEHSSLENEKTRTVFYSKPVGWLIAPYNINYHFEHHCFPKTKWDKLPTLSEKIRGSAVAEKGRYTYGVRALWREFVRPSSHVNT